MDGRSHVAPFVSVVVCTYQREQPLCDTLDMLLKQEYYNYEIIIVDQSTSHLPTTSAFLRSKASFLRYFSIDRPSLPGARNFGIKNARGEIVLFVDDDVEPSPRLVAAHASAYIDPAIGGVAGRRTYPLDSQIQDTGGFVGIIRRDGIEGANFSTTKSTEVEWAPGCNMSFRKELLEGVGGFEVRFRGTAAYEEIDLCARIRSLGYRIVFVPEATLVHVVAPNGGCATRRSDLRVWYSFLHNSLLFSWRNRTLRYKLEALREAVGTIVALIKQGYPLKLTLPLLSTVPHSLLSHYLARDTRPPWPYPLLPLVTP